MTKRIQISPPNFPFAGHTTLKPYGKEDPMEFYVTDACIGCGLCTTLDPDTFAMTEEGVARAVSQPAEAALALAAEEQCPSNAIHHRD